ncbi:chemotaxis response regulator protein-glutamate methylesterase [Herbaspirillum sp. AP02]|uniref:protein-glutamate methylesterase/protein-glutamine glutaminase n=1 Tax=unclassified Herbaspirillum TaxID=2624150 RepID=UPI0015DB7895|nr:MULTISPECIES: chemotaxis response regulator protein-glutamate methylesterase [unclassified Herbaspirillum]MBG7619159.1 chemotaxis response regulator protein-glutamate methylesterase [Herbaspirillum sp. AP02]NZD66443.1 chemotaxis response regulator protein-glutamate methylesterase [Herbaspirillum sp. AP21]
MKTPQTIRVMVIDDSSVVRQLMQQLLAQTADIRVIGTAPDPVFALRKMQQEWPDVILLDIEMPRMDGITFLRQIMASRPTPVIMCSARAGDSSEVAAEALAAGAVSVIARPQLGVREFLHEAVAELASAIRAAMVVGPGSRNMSAVVAVPVAAPTRSVPLLANLRPVKAATREILHDAGWASGLQRYTADAVLNPPGPEDGYRPPTARIVAIGASTGGPQALEKVLGRLDRRCPGIVVVQHMPQRFTRSFAERLHRLSGAEVKEAEHLDVILPGRVLIAPGGKHLVVRRDGLQYYVETVEGPLVSRHKPSVDVLFRSLAKAAGSNAVGIIMTGMGDDGARGMREMADCGAPTYAQDEASSVVFGMPKEAIHMGGVGDVLPLEHISAVIEKYASRESQ